MCAGCKKGWNMGLKIKGYRTEHEEGTLLSDVFFLNVNHTERLSECNNACYFWVMSLVFYEIGICTNKPTRKYWR